VAGRADTTGVDVRASIGSRESNCFYAMARYRAAVHSLHRRPQIIIGTVSKVTAMQRQPERVHMLYRPIFAIQGLKHMAVRVPKALRTNMTPMLASPITYRTCTVISLSPAAGYEDRDLLLTSLYESKRYTMQTLLRPVLPKPKIPKPTAGIYHGMPYITCQRPHLASQVDSCSLPVKQRAQT
jgi:hypothetical protein